jgi:hypothetical protein
MTWEDAEDQDLGRIETIINSLFRVSLGFLMPVKAKSTVFREVLPCNMVQVHWHLKWVECPHLHGSRMSQARNRQETAGRDSTNYDLVLASASAAVNNFLGWPHCALVRTTRTGDMWGHEMVPCLLFSYRATSRSQCNEGLLSERCCSLSNGKVPSSAKS